MARKPEERQPQTRKDAESLYPGLKPGRDCKVYGHHWSYYYGGSYCSHCGTDIPRAGSNPEE